MNVAVNLATTTNNINFLSFSFNHFARILHIPSQGDQESESESETLAYQFAGELIQNILLYLWNLLKIFHAVLRPL